MTWKIWGDARPGDVVINSRYEIGEMVVSVTEVQDMDIDVGIDMIKITWLRLWDDESYTPMIRQSIVDYYGEVWCGLSVVRDGQIITGPLKHR